MVRNTTQPEIEEVKGLCPFHKTPPTSKPIVTKALGERLAIRLLGMPFKVDLTEQPSDTPPITRLLLSSQLQRTLITKRCSLCKHGLIPFTRLLRSVPPKQPHIQPRPSSISAHKR